MSMQSKVTSISNQYVCLCVGGWVCVCLETQCLVLKTLEHISILRIRSMMLVLLIAYFISDSCSGQEEAEAEVEVEEEEERKTHCACWRYHSC